jgi:CRP/FNR family transcriptional regulator
MKTVKNLVQDKLFKRFADIFEKDLFQEIVEIGIYQKCDKGDLLIDIGHEMTHIPLIIDGVVKMMREDQNEEEILLYFLEPGDTCAVSFVNCINKRKSMFRGIVEKDTECILIPVNKIEEWMVNYKSWREFIIDRYHNRLIELVETINSLAFSSLDNRLSTYLSNQMKIMHSKKLKITHQEIANDLHSSRVVISRLLKILEHKGDIKLGRKKIKIKNLQLAD